MHWLRQSTAATIKLGPFVDATDGVTAETGLTISQADIRLSKNGGDFAQSNNAAGATHDENGYYDVPLDTTDTGTLGRLRVAVNESGALPVWMDFMVLPANVYDSLAGSDKLDVNVEEWKGSAAPAMTGDAFARLGAPAGASVSADVAAVKSDTAAILTDTGTTLDGKLDAIDNFLDTEVAAILEDTNELQGDWANGGRLDNILDARASQASVDTVDGIVDAILVDTGTTLDGKIDAIDDLLDTEVAAIKNDTAAILADTGTDGVVLATATKESIADVLLGRNIAGGSNTGRTVKQAFGVLRNKVVISGGTLTVYDTDDTTELFTAAITTDGAAELITELDPA